MKYDLSRYQHFHVNGRWPEEDFLATFGHMMVKDFVVKHMYSLYVPNVDKIEDIDRIWGDQTVKSYYEEILSRSSQGCIRHTFLCGRDDAE